MTRGLALASLVTAAASVGAAHADAPRLQVDDCGVRDPAITDDELRRRGAEHYTRGETLYLQGDYLGAVEELVASYCKIPYFSILKDIGQAYERNLDYELAIAYLDRYVTDVPPDAKRTSACAADPQEDKENVRRRVSVLRQLKARVLVQTVPVDAQITIEHDERIEARGKPGEDIRVSANTYRMRVERPGFETVTREITVQIGKPYTYFFELQPVAGTLAVQATPADARIFIGDRLVGIGRYDARLEAKKYVITSERPGRITDRREVEVLPNQVRRVQVELTPAPQFGRRQLIAYATAAGGTATTLLLQGFDDPQLSGFGSLAGAAAAFLGTYVYLDDDLPLGTSNLTITGSLGATVAGLHLADLLTDDSQVVQPVVGASMIAGGIAGYYLGDRTRIRPGDAALINSSMLWGTVAGGLFYASFDPGRRVGAGLVLSGLGMGTIGGVLMTRYFDISRTHALLIDVGGMIGILGGLAAESFAYSDSVGGQEQQEHIANFSLGGMAVGLIGAGILTRNLDAPKLQLQPAVGGAVGPSGAMTPTYGFSGRF